MAFDVVSLLQGAGGLYNIFQGTQAASSGYRGAADAALFLGDYSAENSENAAAYTASNAIAAASYEASLATQGGAITADSYRQAGAAALVMSNYNQSLMKVDSDKQQKAIADQLSWTLSGNRALQAGSNLGMASRSYLAVAHANISRAESLSLQYSNTAVQSQMQVAYEGQLLNTKYENQARLAEYNARVSADTAIYRGSTEAQTATYQGKVSAQSARYGAQVEAAKNDYLADVEDYKGTMKIIDGATSMVSTLLSGKK